MTERNCVVKLADDHGVEHSFKVRAEFVYGGCTERTDKIGEGWMERATSRKYGVPREWKFGKVYPSPCRCCENAALVEAARPLSRGRDQKRKVANAHQIIGTFLSAKKYSAKNVQQFFQFEMLARLNPASFRGEKIRITG